MQKFIDEEYMLWYPGRGEVYTFCCGGIDRYGFRTIQNNSSPKRTVEKCLYSNEIYYRAIL
jgi:hypothetical protein